jgi:hypothetical protein
MAGLQESPDPALRSLVIGEFDQVPYELLRTVDLKIPASDLLADLWTLQGYPYQAIRALLLGLSDDPTARAEIRENVARAAGRDRAENLGAFAAALIELDGQEAVRALATGMLSDPDQPLDKIDQIVLALSVQNAVADPELRDAISEVVADLVRKRPAAGGSVARHFFTRSDWSQVAPLETLVRNGQLENSADLIAVSVYLARARQPDGTMGNGG